MYLICYGDLIAEDVFYATWCGDICPKTVLKKVKIDAYYFGINLKFCCLKRSIADIQRWADKRNCYVIVDPSEFTEKFVCQDQLKYQGNPFEYQETYRQSQTKSFIEMFQHTTIKMNPIQD